MSTAAVSALNFRKQAVDISRGKIVPRGSTNHFELFPRPRTRFAAASQIESLADPLCDGHAAGSRDPLNFVVDGCISV
jgi:hypothetical protein